MTCRSVAPGLLATSKRGGETTAAKSSPRASIEASAPRKIIQM